MSFYILKSLYDNFIINIVTAKLRSEKLLVPLRKTQDHDMSLLVTFF